MLLQCINISDGEEEDHIADFYNILNGMSPI